MKRTMQPVSFRMTDEDLRLLREISKLENRDRCQELRELIRQRHKILTAPKGNK